MNYPLLLSQCREAFGAAPRRFGLWNRYFYLRLPRPKWCHPQEGLWPLFRDLDSLLKYGEVVWGHVVQANRLMFQPGPWNCPGEMLYCPLTQRAVDPEALGEIAHKLFDLKGTIPRDRQLACISNYLTNERIRVFGLQVPPFLSGTLPCMVSTVFFKRQHLPLRRLCSSLMPLIISPQQPRLAMILPERYWPRELISFWTRQ